MKSWGVGGRESGTALRKLQNFQAGVEKCPKKLYSSFSQISHYKSGKYKKKSVHFGGTT